MEASDEMTPDQVSLSTRRIACAIIEQAWVDLTTSREGVFSASKRREFRTARLSAIGFFDSAWFDELCATMGLDPEPIRSKAQKQREINE